jgi:hypothetical protein
VPETTQAPLTVEGGVAQFRGRCVVVVVVVDVTPGYSTGLDCSVVVVLSVVVVVRSEPQAASKAVPLRSMAPIASRRQNPVFMT